MLRVKHDGAHTAQRQQRPDDTHTGRFTLPASGTGGRRRPLLPRKKNDGPARGRIENCAQAGRAICLPHDPPGMCAAFIGMQMFALAAAADGGGRCLARGLLGKLGTFIEIPSDGVVVASYLEVFFFLSWKVAFGRKLIFRISHFQRAGRFYISRELLFRDGVFTLRWKFCGK